MAKETILCTCPVCGSLVSPDSFNEPHQFNVVKRVMAGKLKRTEAEKTLLHGQKTGRGSGHGNIRYLSQGDIGKDLYLPTVENAVRRAQAGLREEAERR